MKMVEKMVEKKEASANSIIKCADMGNSWVCNADTEELDRVVWKEGLKGLYDRILRATIGKGYDGFEGKIDPNRILISKGMSERLAKTLMAKGKENGAFEFLSRGPSHTEVLDYGVISVYKDAFIMPEKNVEKRVDKPHKEVEIGL